jgi:hypothetical protein
MWYIIHVLRQMFGRDATIKMRHPRTQKEVEGASPSPSMGAKRRAAALIAQCRSLGACMYGRMHPLPQRSPQNHPRVTSCYFELLKHAPK